LVKRQPVLASLGLGLAAACAGDVQATASFSSQLAPRCVLADVAALDPWTLSWEDIARHKAAHGWGSTPYEVDLVSATSGARCPDEVLDRIAAVQRPAVPPEASVEVAVELAWILARNDREESALALLEHVSSALSETGAGFSSRASECAAQIALEAAQWQRALDDETGWIAPTRCGTCEREVNGHKQWVRARALDALDRHAELLELCRSSLDSESTCNHRLIEMWIDIELEQGRASDADQAIANILSDVRPGDRGFCSMALETWKLARAPREEQIEHLADLAAWHREIAVPLILSFTHAELERQLCVFEVVDGRLRSSGQHEISLASVLADLGLPDVGPVLERAKKQCAPDGVDLAQSLLDSWRKGNERWKLLTGEER
jgi:hypothetical protein